MTPTAQKALFSLLALLFAAAPIAGQAALADDHEPQKRTITITGKGSVKAAPDKVSVSAGVETAGADRQGRSRQEHRRHDRRGRGA